MLACNYRKGPEIWNAQLKWCLHGVFLTSSLPNAANIRAHWPSGVSILVCAWKKLKIDVWTRMLGRGDQVHSSWAPKNFKVQLVSFVLFHAHLVDTSDCEVESPWPLRSVSLLTLLELLFWCFGFFSLFSFKEHRPYHISVPLPHVVRIYCFESRQIFFFTQGGYFYLPFFRFHWIVLLFLLTSQVLIHTLNALHCRDTYPLTRGVAGLLRALFHPLCVSLSLLHDILTDSLLSSRHPSFLSG